MGSIHLRYTVFTSTSHQIYIILQVYSPSTHTKLHLQVSKSTRKQHPPYKYPNTLPLYRQTTPPPFPANLQANSPSTSLQVYHLPRPSTSRPPPPTLACFRASNRRERERPCIIQIRLLCKETPAGILSPMVSLLVDVFLSLLGNFRFCS